MKEHGMIFSAPMVRAIDSGRKTQTRRVVKRQRVYDETLRACPASPSGFAWSNGWIEPCRYAVGDLVWVKETFRAFPDGDVFYAADYLPGVVPVHADDDPDKWRWQSPRFMPKRVARLWREITDMRVERAQDISEEDAIAEGIEWTDQGPLHAHYHCENPPASMNFCTAREAFAELWGSINEKRGYGWNRNPWVFAITFGIISNNGEQQ